MPVLTAGRLITTCGARINCKLQIYKELDQSSAHHSIWRTSDAIVLVVLVTGLVLHFLAPVYMDFVVTDFIRIGSGIAIILIGINMIVLARRELNKAGQPSAPGKPTTAVVTSGIFRVSRNPLYLGLVLVLFGLGMTFAVLWWIILTLPMALLIQIVLIGPEERYLLDQFGDEYISYMKKVRCWL